MELQPKEQGGRHVAWLLWLPLMAAVVCLPSWLEAQPSVEGSAAEEDRTEHDRAGGGASPGEPEATADSDAKQRAAREAFQEARAAYARGHFEAALRGFLRAHELAEEHARALLLLNIAQALDRLDREEEALSYYERYLRRMPEGPKAGVARGRVEVLRRRLAERKAEREAARERERRILAEAEARGEAKARQAPLWPWILAGGAVLVAGSVTAALLLGASSDRSVLPSALPPVDFRVEALRR